MTSSFLPDGWPNATPHVSTKEYQIDRPQRNTPLKLPFVHTRYYWYAYVFGELFVLPLHRRYQEEGAAFAPKLIELLEAGPSRSPADLAGTLGYDLESPGFWEKGYPAMEEMIEEVEG
jgi:oligoendopeptidase F